MANYIELNAVIEDADLAEIVVAELADFPFESFSNEPSMLKAYIPQTAMADCMEQVNAMLDLVENECLRPDSRFLEPACGDGNFLSAILKRKLTELRRKYKKSPRDYEKLSIVAIGSLYGVDIMNDNVEACRERLFGICDAEYTLYFLVVRSFFLRTLICSSNFAISFS